MTAAIQYVAATKAAFRRRWPWREKAGARLEFKSHYNRPPQYKSTQDKTTFYDTAAGTVYSVRAGGGVLVN
jgi:hypothetical protein